MIHSLRQRHRIFILALAVLLPAIFIAGLLVRKAAPVNSQLPATTKGVPQ